MKKRFLCLGALLVLGSASMFGQSLFDKLDRLADKVDRAAYKVDKAAYTAERAANTADKAVKTGGKIGTLLSGKKKEARKEEGVEDEEKIKNKK